MRIQWVIFALSVLVSGCSHFPSLQTPYNDRNPLIDGPIEVDVPRRNVPLLSSQGYTFSDAYATARGNPTQGNLRKFLESGMTYADLQCSEYFSRIDWTRAQRDFAQKETTLVGSLTTALLGLADAGSAVTGAVGSAFGFSSSSFDTYNTAFLASTDIGLLQQLVTSAQAQDKNTILKRVSETSGIWPNRIDSLDLAVSDLNTYIGRCTPTGIRNLLKASIEEKTKKQIEGTLGATVKSADALSLSVPEKKAAASAGAPGAVESGGLKDSDGTKKK